MLSIENLTKSYKTSYGRHFVFKNASVDFPEDSNIGILGPNGAGKTTLLRILGGIDYPDSGNIYCDRSISWPLGLRSGFVGNLTGRDNCRLICNIYGLKPQDINKKLEMIKEISGIGDYFEEPFKYYSSGMGGRVGFALSMVFDFEILLIDEITAVGDNDFKKTAKQMIDEKRGRSNVIMVSHSMGNIREFCDVGILLENGKLTVYDNVDDAVRAYLPNEIRESNDSKTGEPLIKRTAELLSAEESEDIRSLREQIDGRIRQIEQALEDGDSIKNEGRLHYFLGLFYFKLKNFKRASEHQKIAVRENPDNPKIHQQLIETLLQIGDIAEAKKALTDASTLWPYDPAFLLLRSSLFFKQGEFEESLETLRTASQLAPDNANIRHALARTLLDTDHPDDQLALQHCLDAIDLNDSSPSFYHTLAALFTRLGRYSESIKALREAEIRQSELFQSRLDKDEKWQLESLLKLLENAHSMFK